MTQELIQRRDEVMDIAWKALDAAWPERKGEEYVRTTRWAVSQIESIAAEMRRNSVDQVEQSRTYRHLGSLYSDLEPALGKQMLLEAKKRYETAEALLEGQSDELERAKLNFNFANALRLIDANDLPNLEEAKRRLLAARTYFAGSAPEYLAQVDSALQSVEGLLAIAPLANAVRRDTEEMSTLQEELSEGKDVPKAAEKIRTLMKRGGGPAGMAARLQAIIASLPPEMRRNKKFAEVQAQMGKLTEKLLGGGAVEPEVQRVMSSLKERLKAEAATNVSRERAEVLAGVLSDFERILSSEEDDIGSLVEKVGKQREAIAGLFELAHYPSYGIERPPAGSRAAEMVESNWRLRRYLLEEMNRPEKGEQESKECLELNIRATRVDRRIYEAGANATVAMKVKREELHPLALAVRDFSARMQSMLAWPLWGSAKVPIDSNAAFYAGPPTAATCVTAACQRAGLEMMPQPTGEGYAAARWNQIQKAVTTIFDLRVAAGPCLASATYELGIAMTLGRPAVVVIAEHQDVPFDVEIEPVVCTGGPKDEMALAAAIEQSLVWTFPRPDVNGTSRTLEYVLSTQQSGQRNVYVDQTLKLLAGLRQQPDPLSISRALAKLFDYLDSSKPMLIHPRWLPGYPDEKTRRLFHVMPFRPKWAKEVTAIARMKSESAAVTYVRGDEVTDPNVIRSIWDEIACATHVLVDLSEFNANVTLELGMAHTLGKKVLAVGQGDTVDRLFPSIRKLRVQTYSMENLQQSLGAAIGNFVRS